MDVRERKILSNRTKEVNFQENEHKNTKVWEVILSFPLPPKDSINNKTKDEMASFCGRWVLTRSK